MRVRGRTTRDLFFFIRIVIVFVCAVIAVSYTELDVFSYLFVMATACCGYILLNKPDSTYITNLEHRISELEEGYVGQEGESHLDKEMKNTPELFVDRLIELMLQDYSNIVCEKIGDSENYFYIYEITEDIHVAICDNHSYSLYFLKTPYDSVWCYFTSMSVSDEREKKIKRLIKKWHSYRDKTRFERANEKVLNEVLNSIKQTEGEDKLSLKEKSTVLVKEKELI